MQIVGSIDVLLQPITLPGAVGTWLIQKRPPLCPALGELIQRWGKCVTGKLVDLAILEHEKLW